MVMESSGGETMAVGAKLPAENLITKSLDNIVGNLWNNARQESSGSSAGNQSPRNGDDLSDGEPLETEERSHTPPPRMDSPEENLTPQLKIKDRRDLLKEDDNISEASDPRDMLKDPRAILAGLPPLPALEAFNRQTRDFLNSPQALLANLKQFGNGSPSGPLIPPNLPPSSLGPLPPLPRPPSQPPTPNSQRSSPVGGAGGGSNQGNWSFEEQFKQLYEIDDNPKRRDFLDELFSMMQKRGTPINRLPIMAKQVLDLYELYNLVLARGGLVEVINKKQWQEVIKGLGLPSSITSAAFTLRTQYTKYLYPLECYKRNLSNPNDLQAAVEGNKREGRRSSYGAYPELSQLQHQLIGGPPPPGIMTSQISPMQLPGHPLTAGHMRPHHMNGNGSIHPPIPPTSASSPGPNGDPLSALEMTRLALWKMYNQAGSDLPKIPGVTPGLPSNFPSIPGFPAAAADLLKAQQDKAFDLQMAERQKMALEAVAIETAAREAADRKEAAELKEQQRRLNNDSNDNHTSSADEDVIIGRERRESGHGHNGVNGERDSRGSVPPNGRDNDEIIGQDELLEGEEDNYDETSSMSPPANKRLRHSSNEDLSRVRDRDGSDNERASDESSPRKRPAPGYNTTSINAAGLPGANIKISSRNDGRSGDSSLVVSLEINGTNYQGVLFAQSAKRRSS